VAPKRHRQRSPEFATVAAPAELVDFEAVALAPHQLSHPSLVRATRVRPTLVRRRTAGRNVAAKFRKKLSSIRAGQSRCQSPPLRTSPGTADRGRRRAPPEIG